MVFLPLHGQVFNNFICMYMCVKKILFNKSFPLIFVCCMLCCWRKVQAANFGKLLAMDVKPCQHELDHFANTGNIRYQNIDKKHSSFSFARSAHEIKCRI